MNDVDKWKDLRLCMRSAQSQSPRDSTSDSIRRTIIANLRSLDPEIASCEDSTDEKWPTTAPALLGARLRVPRPGDTLSCHVLVR